MKKSITISVAIILAVIVIALYQGAHQHLTAFDAMLFTTLFIVGYAVGKYHATTEYTVSLKTLEAEQEKINSEMYGLVQQMKGILGEGGQEKAPTMPTNYEINNPSCLSRFHEN